MTIEIQDLCLDVGGVAEVGVVVGVVDTVEVSVADKVQVRNTTMACVHVLDGDGQPYQVSQFR